MAAAASANSLIRLERAITRNVSNDIIAVDLGDSADVVGVLWKGEVNTVRISYQVGENKEDFEYTSRQKMGCTVGIRGATNFQIRSTVGLEVYLVHSSTNVYAQPITWCSGRLGGNIGTRICGNNLSAQWWNLPEKLSYRCIAYNVEQEYDVVLFKRTIGRLVPGSTSVLDLPSNNDLGQDENRIDEIFLHPTHPTEDLSNWGSFQVNMIVFGVYGESK